MRPPCRASAPGRGRILPSRWPTATRTSPLFLWQVCYGAQTPFLAIPGTNGTTTIGGTTYHTGLLLPCFLFTHRHPQPCLLSRQRIQGGAVKLTFIAQGDPFGRG